MSQIETLKGNGGSYSNGGTVYTDTLRYVSELADTPQTTTSLLKSEFDRSSFEIQKYINEVLVPKINELDSAIDSGVKAGGIYPYHLNAQTNNAIKDIADNSVSNVFTNGSVDENKIANNSVVLAKLSNEVKEYFRKSSDLIPTSNISGTINSAQILSGAVSWDKLSIQIFDNNSARDSAISSPSEGQIVLVKRS